MRRRILAISTILMLFLGLIYAWSLFAAPLEQAFNWSRSQTSITFSISMITFCLGSIISGMILKRRPPSNIILVSAILFLIGFFATSRVTSIWGLYISYGVLCGLGVGLSYNAILSTVPKWYFGRAGFATGTLLMGMGLGSLLLGTVVKKVMDILIWVTTFKMLAIVFFLVFLLGAPNIKYPRVEKDADKGIESSNDYHLSKVLKMRDFWMLFIWSIITSAVGLGIVSNASYMAEEVGISKDILPLMVGMVSIGNGAGRLIFGTIVDKLGGKKAMGIGNLTFIIGLGLIMFANRTGVLIYLIIGFILEGIAYGAPPTLSAALTKKKFGEKYYPQNLSAIMLALIPASLIGPIISADVYERSGAYLAVYSIMLVMALLAFLPVKLFRE
ncbi:MAG TPA: OFA family MFS transporter [Tepidimicrobium sp.]|nr:OFA family MFS transporter [Tepidimicrobium sp.]